CARGLSNFHFDYW
nr:immunoglobulin heavy chain junction region [Mus musculus]